MLEHLRAVWTDSMPIRSAGSERLSACPEFLSLARARPRHPRCLEYSLRLSPRARVGSQPYVLGLAYFMNRQFDQASQHLQTAIQEQPGSPLVHRALVACYAHMGRLANAREMVARLRAMNSTVLPPNTSYFRNPEHRELFLSGLRLAAGEER